jgi:long-chain acyl-CoA synthetase
MAPQTIPELWATAVREHPRPDCFASKDRQGRYAPLSSAEAWEQVQALRLALAEAGIVPGARAAILSENRVEWALADLAVLGNGGADVPIYPTLLPETIAFILKDCRPTVLFLSTPAQAEKIAAIRGELPFIEHIYCFDPAPLRGTVTFAELLERGRRLRREQGGDPAPAAVAPQDLASIIYTSGTTGPPKGVMLSHGNFVSNVLAAAGCVPLFTTDRCLSFLPLSHVLERMAGFYLMVHAGIGIAYAEAVDTVPQDMLAVRPTIVVSVPRLYEKIYARILGTALAGPKLRKHIFFWAKRQGERYGRHKRENRPIHWWARRRPGRVQQGAGAHRRAPALFRFRRRAAGAGDQRILLRGRHGHSRGVRSDRKLAGAVGEHVRAHAPGQRGPADGRHRNPDRRGW